MIMIPSHYSTMGYAAGQEETLRRLLLYFTLLYFITKLRGEIRGLNEDDSTDTVTSTRLKEQMRANDDTTPHHNIAVEHPGIPQHDMTHDADVYR